MLNEWPLHVFFGLQLFGYQLPAFFVFLLRHSPVIVLQTNILLLVSVQMLLSSAHSAGVAIPGLIQISAVEIKHV